MPLRHNLVVLPFLDRRRELGRLKRGLRGAGFVCLYGRRRCGKSRLLAEALRGRRVALYVADERDGVLQRAALATEMARLVPGFDRVSYPGWDELLARFWADAPAGAVLAIDELPYLVARVPELPSLLQKRVDAKGRVALAVAGSSQRMMEGLVLDASAPLYGRATEILRVAPLNVGEVPRALGVKEPRRTIEAYATWGGVPRYLELAARFRSWRSAVRELVLDPLGVLHEEPARLLLDDFRDVVQASSVLALVGSGCHRVTEIAARLGRPATAARSVAS
jgi:AAA+ ATPase superfamily predicted ATPase